MEKNINKFDDLPNKTPMRLYKGKIRFYHNQSTGVYRKIDNKFPWTHVERTLRKFKGKNVDKAFSAYCKIVDSCQQFLFWDEIERSDENNRRYNNRYPYWYLDANKNIQRFKPKKEKSKYVIYSHDIKWGYIHKVTGEIEDKWYRYANNESYEYGVIQGEVFEFDKKGDAYHRRFADELSKKRKSDREERKVKAKKEYSFLTDEEETKIKNIEIDKVIKESKGFDDISFTNTGGRLNE